VAVCGAYPTVVLSEKTVCDCVQAVLVEELQPDLRAAFRITARKFCDQMVRMRADQEDKSILDCTLCRFQKFHPGPVRYRILSIFACSTSTMLWYATWCRTHRKRFWPKRADQTAVSNF